MITDTRSDKAAVYNATTNAAAEMVWWFPKRSEQYRIRGTLLLVGTKHATNDEYLQRARCHMWSRLSDAAREAFYDAAIPGIPWSSSSSAAAKTVIPPGGRDAETGKVLQPPPDTFLLMLLRPHYCDYLKLGGEQYRQIDERHESDNGNLQWTSQRVNP